MVAPFTLTLAPDADAKQLLGELARRGLWARRLEVSSGPTLLEVDEKSRAVAMAELVSITGVASVAGRASAHPLVDARRGRAVPVGAIAIGRGQPHVHMAGPCAVESEKQIDRLAEVAARAGARLLRGSAYKPRTSPYAFQGHGAPALGWLRAAATRHGLGVVTEVMTAEDAGRVAEVADLVQVGSRNMQNFSLLKAVGREKRPVLLKRGMAASVEDWLLAAEYCLSEGAAGVVFCERGVRGFDPTMRNLLDLGAVALLAHALEQPVVVDPSHAAGRRDLIPALGRAGSRRAHTASWSRRTTTPRTRCPTVRRPCRPSSSPRSSEVQRDRGPFPGHGLARRAQGRPGSLTEVRPGSGQMFDRIARRYDLLNRILSFGIDRGWRRQATRALGDAKRVLDLATGTGDLALEIARQLPSAQIVASDPSEGMLEVGRVKVADKGLGDRIEMVVGDAEKLPFPDRQFDAVTIAFGIRNVPDRPRALAEMARVTRDGGPSSCSSSPTRVAASWRRSRASTCTGSSRASVRCSRARPSIATSRSPSPGSLRPRSLQR